VRLLEVRLLTAEVAENAETNSHPLILSAISATSAVKKIEK
jgi:hypothetical protein